ncbi:MAG: thiamine pyrophosphate-dependent enzyme [Rhodospirillaceae bacterium]|jgi:thiamine pyrophosphate-dependent acetolactate synthase large subunit-like protein
MSDYSLKRREVVHRILENRGDAAVITGIGNASHDVASAGDNSLNMYLFGVMGGAVMTAFGVAIAQPNRRVLVITGDGELLAGIGSLATVGVERPDNLSIIVIDNQAYGATGGQLTHTAAGVDLVGIAKASGIKRSELLQSWEDVERCVGEIYGGEGPFFGVVKVSSAQEPRVNVPNDGTLTARRFRGAISLSEPA